MKLKLDKEFKQIDSDIFWVGKVDYIDREYETLYDSKGNSHYVQVGYEHKSTLIDEGNYKSRSIGGDKINEIVVDDKTFDIDSGTFQVNLNKYNIHYPGYQYSSMYSLVRGIINDNIDRYKHIIRHYLLDDCKYYFPIYENCFTSGNNTEIENAIEDRLFFSFDDRLKAVNSVNPRAAQKLKNLNYIFMNETQFNSFMIKRLDEYIKMKKKYPSIFE